MSEAEIPGSVLVTGGAGFIGSQIVDALVEEGRDVRVLDCLHPLAHAGEPDHLNPGAEYIWGDVTDPDITAVALRGIDAVSHQAAMVGLGRDFADASEYVRNNELGTAVLLSALHERSFRGKVVLAGSMVVYGEGRYSCSAHGLVPAPPRSEAALQQGRFEPACPSCGRSLHAEPVPESAPLDPRNVYATTKLSQEHLCAAFARESGSSVIALRYHNVYGPRMPRDTPYAGVASIFRSSLAAGQPPCVFEDGAQMRDFVHVSDVARANVLALDAPARLAGAFNIASGEPHSIGDMARALADELGGSPPVISGRYRLGDVRHVYAAPDRARKGLGFSARVSFAEGMRRFAADDLRATAGSR